MKIRTENAVLVVVLSMAVIVPGAFIINFWHEPIAPTADRWGQLGDYLGGLLNPLVALAALSLLALSIRIQRRELSETREVLSQQAQSAADTARLTALTSLIASTLAEVGMLREHLTFLVHQLSEQDEAVRAFKRTVHFTGQAIDPDQHYELHSLEGAIASRDATVRMADMISKGIEASMVERLKLEGQIRKILKGQRGEAGAA